jgi:hypothetical protein
MKKTLNRQFTELTNTANKHVKRWSVSIRLGGAHIQLWPLGRSRQEDQPRQR